LSYAVLTGARDGAIASTRLKHVDLTEETIFQDGRDMRTKFAKSFPTFFFPVGGEFKSDLRDWLSHLRSVHAFGPDDPLFPPIKSVFGPDGVAQREFERRCWTNATPIRKVFRSAFERVGLPAFHPHSVRKMLVRLGLELGIGEAGLRAWSQNLGHDGVITTLKSYGELPPERQRDLIRAAAHAKEDEVIALRLGREMLRTMRQHGVS
jgi:integrase